MRYPGTMYLDAVDPMLMKLGRPIREEKKSPATATAMAKKLIEAVVFEQLKTDFKAQKVLLGPPAKPVYVQVKLPLAGGMVLPAPKTIDEMRNEINRLISQKKLTVNIVKSIMLDFYGVKKLTDLATSMRPGFMDRVRLAAEA